MTILCFNLFHHRIFIISRILRTTLRWTCTSNQILWSGRLFVISVFFKSKTTNNRWGLFSVISCSFRLNFTPILLKIIIHYHRTNHETFKILTILLFGLPFRSKNMRDYNHLTIAWFAREKFSTFLSWRNCYHVHTYVPPLNFINVNF